MFLRSAEGGEADNWAEWDFIQNLSYGKHLSEEEARFVKLMYTTKLKKVNNTRDIGLC